MEIAPVGQIDPSRGEGWLSRRAFCAQHVLSVRALRRLRKQGQVEHLQQDKLSFYRMVEAEPEPEPEPEAEPEAVPAEGVDTGAETDQAWLDVIPIRTARKSREAPRQGEAARLESLLRLALEQREEALEASRAAAQRQREVGERLEALQERFDESIKQRDEAVKARKRLQGERDELARKLALAIRQRDAAIVGRAEATHRNDELACELNLAHAERDKLTRRREELIARLDRTVQQREYAQRQLEQAHQLLVEWQAWRDQAEETLRATDERTVAALRLAADALRTPWWGVKRRRELQGQLHKLLKGQ
jgi:hypothetical protein